MHNPVRHVLGLLALGGVGVAGACGRNAPAPTRDSLGADSAQELTAAEALRFMVTADQGEVQAAQRGARLATNADVRRFAQLMWREHSRSARDVSDLARQMEVDLQTSAPSGTLVTNVQTMSQQTAQLLDRTPRGAAFDGAYLDAQIRMHQAVLQGLQRIARGGGRGVGADVAPGAGVDVGAIGTPSAPVDATPAANPAARGRSRAAATPQEAARMAIPRVQQHLDSARQLRARLGVGGG